MNKPTEYQPDTVSPPGETLQETLDFLGMSQSEFASRTGLSKKTINQIVSGTAPISHETALAFEKVLGTPSEFWLNRESKYQDYLARQEEDKRLQKFVKWAKGFPLGKMVEFGWLDAGNKGDWAGCCARLLSFFAVAGPEQWEAVWSRPQVSFRRSQETTDNLPIVATWLRQGERQAASETVQPYDEAMFKANLQEIRRLTTGNLPVILPKWKSLCGEAGVHLQFVRELPKLGVSGATWWQSDNPVIQLSLRFKTNDHLWFTFFHETKHVLQKVKKRVFLDAPVITDDHDPLETEANHWAGEFLIPSAQWRPFQTSGKFTPHTTTAFARSIGIHPGIVVGRLQHEKLIHFSFLNDLKAKVTWA